MRMIAMYNIQDCKIDHSMEKHIEVISETGCWEEAITVETIRQIAQGVHANNLVEVRHRDTWQLLMIDPSSAEHMLAHHFESWYGSQQQIEGWFEDSNTAIMNKIVNGIARRSTPVTRAHLMVDEYIADVIRILDEAEYKIDGLA